MICYAPTLGVPSPIVKTTIYKQLSREKLVRVLPEIFNVQVPGSIPQPTTAVVFRDQVVTSRIARKAIGRVGTDFGASVIFAALDFTREASELAAAHKSPSSSPTVLGVATSGPMIGLWKFARPLRRIDHYILSPFPVRLEMPHSKCDP